MGDLCVVVRNESEFHSFDLFLEYVHPKFFGDMQVLTEVQSLRL